MKVILLEDIKTLGKKNDIVEVKESYGRNALIKTGKAKEATGANLNDLKLKMANDDKNAAIALANAEELKGVLSSQSVEVSIKVGSDGRVFGSVTSKEISEAIKSQLGLDIDKKKIIIKEPIKATGSFDIDIKLHVKVSTQIKVIVKGN